VLAKGDGSGGVRLVELVAALSLATDLGLGLPQEHVLRQTTIAARLAAEGQDLPLEDYAEFSPIARRVAAHEQRDRIVTLLLRKYFEPPPAEPEEEETQAPAPPAGARPRREGSGFDPRRRRRR
jgi:hypothetical protein